MANNVANGFGNRTAERAGLAAYKDAAKVGRLGQDCTLGEVHYYPDLSSGTTLIARHDTAAGRETAAGA